MNRSYALSNAPRRSLIALLCMAAASGVFAQEDASRTRMQTQVTPPLVERGPGVPGADTGVPPGPIGQVKAVTLGCCRCLGETLGPIHISTGMPNPHTVGWTVNNGTATTITSPHPNWQTAIPTPPPLAQWIGPNATGSSVAPGLYTYELKIDVLRCFIPSTVVVSGTFWADNMGTVSMSGPGPITGAPVTTNGSQWGFLPINGVSFSYSFSNPGTYTLKVLVRNEASPTGMLMKATVSKRCITEPIGPGLPGNPASTPN